jgi:Flp pilus assembly protein TadD
VGWRLKTNSTAPLLFYSKQAVTLCQFLMLDLWSLAGFIWARGKRKATVAAPRGLRGAAIVRSVARAMTPQEQYDDAMFDFSRGDFAGATVKLRSVLAQDAANFEAQLALGMALYRRGDFAAAIAEGHKAEKLRPKEQLVHTNLSLFYMKSGDKVTAEHHGLEARIAGWRAENQAAKSNVTETKAADDPELQMAKPKPPAVKVVRMPDKFPEQPWKKK